MQNENLLKDGVFVVIERHPVSPEWVVGTASSLDGAMRLVLDAGEFELLVPASDPDDPEACDAVKVDSSDERAVKAFRWHDDDTCGGRYPSRFTMGQGTLNAYFQDEATAFYVHWTMFRD